MFERIFGVRYAYPDALNRRRASALVAISVLITALLALDFVLGFIPALVTQGISVLREHYVLALILPVAAIWWLVQNGRLRTAAWVLVIGLMLVNLEPVLSMLLSGRVSAFSPLNIAPLMFMPLVVAGVMLKRRDLVIVALVLFGMMVIRVVVFRQLNTEVVFNVADVATSGFGVAAVSVAVVFGMLYLFNGFADNILVSQVADTGHLRDVAQYLPAVDEIQDEATLLARTIDIVRDDMKYAVTQIYLLDEERKVSRRMSSGLGKRETGMVINLREADARVISDVTRLRQPITVSRKSERGAYIVPPAQIAVALPVMHHDELLAVMDVQSDQTEFADNEITTLMLMAQQLGVSLAHLRRVKDLEAVVREQEETTGRLQVQLQAMRNAGDQSIARGWSNFFQGQGRALGYDLKAPLTGKAEPELIAANALTPSMRQAMEQGDIHIDMSPLNQQTLNVPIIFRGQMLGAMAFTLARGQVLSERQLEMTRIIADRLAVALENTRLFESSQEQVRREQKATEAAGAMMSANDVKSVLNLAAQTFNQALGAVYTGIHLQPGVLTDAVTASHRPEEGTNPA